MKNHTELSEIGQKVLAGFTRGNPNLMNDAVYRQVASESLVALAQGMDWTSGNPADLVLAVAAEITPEQP